MTYFGTVMARKKTIKEPKTAVIPIRFSPEYLCRIDKVAGQLGTSRSSLIVYLIQCFVDQFERLGEVTLPLNWKRQVEEMDGRTKASCDLKDATLKALQDYEKTRYPKPSCSASSLNEKNAEPNLEVHKRNNAQDVGK